MVTGRSATSQRRSPLTTPVHTGHKEKQHELERR